MLILERTVCSESCGLWAGWVRHWCWQLTWDEVRTSPLSQDLSLLPPSAGAEVRGQCDTCKVGGREQIMTNWRSLILNLLLLPVHWEDQLEQGVQALCGLTAPIKGTWSPVITLRPLTTFKSTQIIMSGHGGRSGQWVVAVSELTFQEFAKCWHQQWKFFSVDAIGGAQYPAHCTRYININWTAAENLLHTCKVCSSQWVIAGNFMIQTGHVKARDRYL